MLDIPMERSPQGLMLPASELYVKRSFSSPFFLLRAPFLWSESPLALLVSLPLRAPVASLATPLSVSLVASRLSCLLLFMPLPDLQTTAALDPLDTHLLTSTKTNGKRLHTKVWCLCFSGTILAIARAQ